MKKYIAKNIDIALNEISEAENVNIDDIEFSVVEQSGFSIFSKVEIEYYTENEVKAKSYLIGHNFYSTFLQHIGAKIQHFDCDSTLVRENSLNISENFDDTWGELLKLYLKSLKNRG